MAQRLQQLYNDVLRHFDQVYINSIVARLRRSQASGQLPPQPPQPQAQPHQPTEADYQALLASIISEPFAMKTMSILPRFSRTSGAELEAHHVPQHVITFVEQNREQLQRAARDQNGFRASLTSPMNASLDNRSQVDHASAHGVSSSSAPQPPPQLHSISVLPPILPVKRELEQGNDLESSRSLEGMMSYREGLFDDEVRIAMSKLEI